MYMVSWTTNVLSPSSGPWWCRRVAERLIVDLDNGSLRNSWTNLVMGKYSFCYDQIFKPFKTFGDKGPEEDELNCCRAFERVAFYLRVYNSNNTDNAQVHAHGTPQSPLMLELPSHEQQARARARAILVHTVQISRDQTRTVPVLQSALRSLYIEICFVVFIRNERSRVKFSTCLWGNPCLWDRVKQILDNYLSYRKVHTCTAPSIWSTLIARRRQRGPRHGHASCKLHTRPTAHKSFNATSPITVPYVAQHSRHLSTNRIQFYFRQRLHIASLILPKWLCLPTRQRTSNAVARWKGSRFQFTRTALFPAVIRWYHEKGQPNIACCCSNRIKRTRVAVHDQCSISLTEKWIAYPWLKYVNIASSSLAPCNSRVHFVCMPCVSLRVKNMTLANVSQRNSSINKHSRVNNGKRKCSYNSLFQLSHPSPRNNPQGVKDFGREQLPISSFKSPLASPSPERYCSAHHHQQYAVLKNVFALISPWAWMGWSCIKHYRMQHHDSTKTYYLVVG